MDLKEYWRQVREAGNAIIANGQSSAFITSIEMPFRPEWRVDVVSEASPELAGKCIVDRTHRLSSAEEIENFKSEQRRREAVCAANSQILHRKTGRMVLTRTETDEISKL
jgi:hypothetical protein